MNLLSGLFSHIVYLLSFRHQGTNLPQNWGPSVYFILFIAITTSQLNLVVLSKSLTEQQLVEQSISASKEDPKDINKNPAAGIPVEQSGTSTNSAQNSSNTLKPFTPNHVGALFTQIVSYVFISIVGSIPLMCAFALITIGVDSLKITFTLLQFPVLLIYFWEIAAVVSITWRMIRHKLKQNN